VVHQDYVHEWLPHIHVTMGLLDDAFEFAGFAAPSSVLFVPTRRIEPGEIPLSSKDDISDDDKLVYFDRACRHFGGEERAILDCARAVLLQELGRHNEAMATVEGVPVQVSTRVAASVVETRSWLLRSHPDPAISTPAWERWYAERER